MKIKEFIRGTAPLLSVLALALGHGNEIFPSANAKVGTSGWFVTEQNEVRLLSATKGIGGRKSVKLGLQFRLRKGWKIYWRSPGDAGFPPRIYWGKSQNLENIKFHWPVPTRFQVLGLNTVGYENEVVFPITAYVKDPDQPLKLNAELQYLTCNDICIPYKTELTVSLPAGKSGSTDHSQLIRKFVAKVPGEGIKYGLNIEKVETIGEFTLLEEGVRKGIIRVVATSALPFRNPDIFVEGPELTSFLLPEVKIENGGRRAIIYIPAVEEDDTHIETANLKFTLVDNGRYATQTHTVKAATSKYGALEVPPTSFAIILVLAIVGGLILNLMPCVLPVLSLKLMSFVSYGGTEKKLIRMSFIASSLGILFSFLIIATVLAGLKLAGLAVGWGFQFQHPWFIICLTVILSLFAYNLWGLFEINLPAWIGNRLGGGDRRTKGHPGFIGNFCTGAFATILATPCSAPFVGTAVGFALAGSLLELYAVFLGLGTGMALPFIIIILVPKAVSGLPKAGKWMLKVKFLMGCALAITAAWLISILAVQLTIGAAFVLTTSVIYLGAILFVRQRLIHHWRIAALASIPVVVLAVFVASYQYKTTDSLASDAEPHWAALEPEKIPQLVAKGKTVFVDVTAEWCLTCQVNKTTVLNRGGIFEVLSSGGNVIAMKGDWTRPNPKITAYLKKFGRFGIPFNAVYGPYNERGILLPELLTQGLVWEALRKASGGAVASKKLHDYKPVDQRSR